MTDDDVLSVAEADALAARFRPRRPLKSSFEGHTQQSHREREAQLGRPLTDRGGNHTGPTPRAAIQVIRPPSATDEHRYHTRNAWATRPRPIRYIIDTTYMWARRAEAYKESLNLRRLT